MLSKSNIFALVKLIEYKNGLTSTGSNGDLQIGADNSNLFLENNVVTEGPLTCSSSLYVSGYSIFNGPITGLSTLNMSGNTTLQGPITGLSTLNMSGNTTLQGPITGLSTLNMSGVTTINNTLKAQEVQQQYGTNTFGLLVPTGSIITYGGSVSPAGWLLCDGTAVSRTTYATLFAILGTTYGNGDGINTFNLPNMKGRVAVGRDAGQTEFDSLGETGGSKTHTLTVNEMPSHDHGGSTGAAGYSASAHDVAVSLTTTGTADDVGSHTHSIAPQGGGQPHNILQPYIVVNYIIKF
jgi:microcystin-dependent protein